jgi:hypothetical protein
MKAVMNQSGAPDIETALASPKTVLASQMTYVASNPSPSRTRDEEPSATFVKEGEENTSEEVEETSKGVQAAFKTPTLMSSAVHLAAKHADYSNVNTLSNELLSVKQGNGNSTLPNHQITKGELEI